MDEDLVQQRSITGQTPCDHPVSEPGWSKDPSIHKPVERTTGDWYCERCGIHEDLFQYGPCKASATTSGDRTVSAPRETVVEPNTLPDIAARSYLINQRWEDVVNAIVEECIKVPLLHAEVATKIAKRANETRDVQTVHFFSAIASEAESIAAEFRSLKQETITNG